MAKKKNDEPKVYKEHPSVDQRITDTLRENYMPYAMSVIVSRAIPAVSYTHLTLPTILRV